MKYLTRLLVFLLLPFLLSACGQRGPLYMPNGTVTPHGVAAVTNSELIYPSETIKTRSTYL